MATKWIVWFNLYDTKEEAEEAAKDLMDETNYQFEVSALQVPEKVSKKEEE